MSKDSMKRKIEDLLGMPAGKLKDNLPLTLEEIRSYGIGKALGEFPDFFLRVIYKLKEIDVAKFLCERPAVSDQFADLLWEGLSHLAERSEGIESLLEKAERDLHVNIEASDSPFKSHFLTRQKKITGGSGLLPFREEDFRFMGPTEVLLDLLTGDLPLGFSNLRLQTSGHSGWVSRVSPIIKEINKIMKGTSDVTMASGV